MEVKSKLETPLLTFNRVSRFFKPDKAALFDVSLNIYKGEFVYVFGPSGAGKSTLLSLIHAEEEPDTGSVQYTGIDLSSLKQRAIAILRRTMGLVLQDFKLVLDLCVSANIAIPLEVAGLSKKTIVPRVEEMLERVSLENRGSELAGTLSGGEQQRVAVARALVGDPEIILADEPTCSLDAYNADFVLDLLEKAAEKGTTVVLATHDRMLMAARPHRTISLNQGRVIGMSSDGTETITQNKKFSANLQQAG